MADGGSSDSGESDDGELPQRAQESRQRRRRRRRWRRWLAWAWLKLNGVLWIGTSVILIERSNLFSVIWTCSALHSGPLWAGASSLAASLALLFFLAVVQPLRGYEPKKLAEDQPWTIQALVGLWILSFFFLCTAFWPVWKWWGILMMVSFPLAFLHCGHFLPGGIIGGLLMFAVLIAVAVVSPKYIGHEGEARTYREQQWRKLHLNCHPVLSDPH
eukprot:GHVT01049691.1.p1 GENE.GHVT01049691.1~~GHVT01049691.1.p1  ORF type:complete len:216 (+),score=26.43 GHVT01049691.1:1032-1679(+)